MTWGKIHGSITWHVKALAAGDAALGVWVRLLGHCALQLTDGFVAQPVAIAVSALTPGAIDALVKAGLLEPVDGGYELHDYLEHNAARADISAAREASRSRMAKSRERKKPHSTSGCTATLHATNTATIRATNTVGCAVGCTGGCGACSFLEEDVEKKEDSLRSSSARATTDEPASPTSIGQPALSLVATQPVHKAEQPTKKAPTKQASSDSVPATGTPARALYDAIVADPLLGDSVARPGEYAQRVLDSNLYPHVDLVAAVKRAGIWLDGKPERERWKSGRAGLSNWFERDESRAREAAKAEQSATPAAYRPYVRPPEPPRIDGDELRRKRLEFERAAAEARAAAAGDDDE